MTNLATIQKIKSVKVHPNADSLDLVQVLGWEVVAKRNEFKVGDLVVYICIDTILPAGRPEFEFLKDKHYRIKPIRLRGSYSNGICFPVNIVPGFVSLTNNKNGFFVNWKNDEGEIHKVLEEGDDVTEVLNITHYEKPVAAQLMGQAVGSFPGFLRITDEDSLRSYPLALSELQGKPYYITQKIDGSSGTFFIKDGEFGVCSRRIHLKESETNGFWRIAKKYDIENALKAYFPNRNIAIQGECAGPGIQKNPLNLKDLSFFLFDIYDINEQIYFSLGEIIKFSNSTNIPMVEIIEQNNSFDYSLDILIKLSNSQKYLNEFPAEGIVIRSNTPFYSQALKKRWSSKIINENYKD